MRTHSSTGRFAAVALAAAVVAVPLFAAAPANAAADVVTSFSIPDTELAYGETTQTYFNGDTALTSIDGFNACIFQYSDGVESNNSGVQPTAIAQTLNAYDYQIGSYTIAYADPVEDEGGNLSCVAPDLSTPGLVQASFSVVAAPLATEVPMTIAPFTLTQGVAVNIALPITLGAGFDSTTGSYAAAGPQSSAGLENGEIYPLEGLRFEYANENTPGVVPTISLVGTPKYAGTYVTGVEIGNPSTVGRSELPITIASALGTTGPIAINAAIGAPVAGAEFTVVASGLKEGAAWDATVRSTPIVVGSGTIGFEGTLNRTFSIPAGLEAGAHSITVTSTNADGSAFSAVLYFRVSATGTLLAVSSTPIALLANTGADLTTPAFLAGGLLLAGIALAGVTVYRRRSA